MPVPWVSEPLWPATEDLSLGSTTFSWGAPQVLATSSMCTPNQEGMINFERAQGSPPDFLYSNILSLAYELSHHLMRMPSHLSCTLPNFYSMALLDQGSVWPQLQAGNECLNVTERNQVPLAGISSFQHVTKKPTLLKGAHYANICTFRRKKSNMEMIFGHRMPYCNNKISLLHNKDLKTDANQTNPQLTALANYV